MGNNSYFQRAARQIKSSMSVLEPPRYLTRRMETGQFEGFISMGSDFSIHQFPDHTKRQRDFGHTSDSKEAAQLPMNSAISLDESLSPISIAGTKQFVDSDKFNPGEEASLGAISELTATQLFPSDENTHKGYQEEAGFVPAQSENYSKNAVTDFLSSSLHSNTLAQSIMPTNFSTSHVEPNVISNMADLHPETENKGGQEETGFLPIQSKSHSKDEVTDTLSSLISSALVQSIRPASFSTTHMEANVISNMASLNSETEIQWQLPVPEFYVQTNTQGKVVSTNESNIETNAIDNNLLKADSNRMSNAKESSSREKTPMRDHVSATNKSEVIIGTVEIAVAALSKAVKSAKLGTTSSKLSLARGITRAYGLRQG